MASGNVTITRTGMEDFGNQGATNIAFLKLTGPITLPSGMSTDTNAAVSATSMTQFFQDNTISIGSMATT